MNKQIITTPAGERLVILPEAEYDALVDLLDEKADEAALRDVRARLTSGAAERIPAAVVDRIIAGENPLRVWREHRRMTVSALASETGLSQPFLTQIETGKRDGSAATLEKIAAALDIGVDQIG